MAHDLFLVGSLRGVEEHVVLAEFEFPRDTPPRRQEGILFWPLPLRGKFPTVLHREWPDLFTSIE